MGIQFLSQFDRAYGRQTRAEKRVKLHIKAVSDYREALEKASGPWGIPALYYETASGYKNQPFGFSAIGEWDKLTDTAPSGKKRCWKIPPLFPMNTEYTLQRLITEALRVRIAAFYS